MQELSKRLAVISEIVSKHENLGKTTMMKFIFLLQQVYKVPLGYDYDIYTYGPYSPVVAGDVNYAADFDVIQLVSSSNHTGYELRVTKQTPDIISNEKDFIEEHGQSISTVIELFGEKTTRDLELITTIIYFYSLRLFLNKDTSVVPITERVKAIKPRFETEIIEAEYEYLESLGILEKLREV